jgi:hypothetical protein
VRLATAREDQAGSGGHQEQDGSGPQKEQEKLAEPDPAGMLPLGSQEVAQGREDETAVLMAPEEVQEDRDRHGGGGQ